MTRRTRRTELCFTGYYSARHASLISVFFWLQQRDKPNYGRPARTKHATRQSCETLLTCWPQTVSRWFFKLLLYIRLGWTFQQAPKPVSQDSENILVWFKISVLVAIKLHKSPHRNTLFSHKHLGNSVKTVLPCLQRCGRRIRFADTLTSNCLLFINNKPTFCQHITQHWKRNNFKRTRKLNIYNIFSISHNLWKCRSAVFRW